MERKARIYEFGQPYLTGSSGDGLNQGVCYSYPEYRNSESRHEWENRFRERREELSDFLLEKLDGYINTFDVFRSIKPYAQITEKGTVLHMGQNGRWIEVYPMLGGFLAFHNLDSCSEAISGFNIGSDALEFLEETLLCPRINKKNSLYEIIYPIPKGESFSEKDIEKFSNPEIYNRWFEIGKLSEPVLTEPFGYEFKEGKILVEDKEIKALTENGWKVWGMTFVTAKLLDTFKFGR